MRHQLMESPPLYNMCPPAPREELDPRSGAADSWPEGGPWGRLTAGIHQGRHQLLVLLTFTLPLLQLERRGYEPGPRSMLPAPSFSLWLWYLESKEKPPTSPSSLPRENPLTHVCANFRTHQNLMEGLLKLRLLRLVPRALIQQVWDGAGECAFPTSSQGLLWLQIRGAHFKNEGWALTNPYISQQQEQI